MLNESSLAFLLSDAGSELLAEAAACEGDLLARLTRLRRRHSPELASAALQLLELRARAAPKFSRAAEMFFTPEGLEQSSGEVIARWRAGRFPSGAAVLDLCGGIGGDAVLLAGRGPVLSVDRDFRAALCARGNAAASGVSDNLSLACADVTKLNLNTEALAFFDPSRRAEGRRARHARDYAPPLDFLHTIRAAIPDLAVKVSPALEDTMLESFGGRVEFVSDRGECKEALLWFGALGPAAARSATVLPANVSLSANPDAPPPTASSPGAWLYEPDPAVTRAHLIAETAALLDAQQIDSQIAFLTADQHQETPFAVAYRVIEWLPFHLRRIRERLRALDGHAAAVKRRGVPFEVADVEKALPRAGGRPLVIVLTRVRNAPAAILCEAR